MPKVSFVVSIFNAEKYLRPFLDSIFLQDYPDYEVILVDADSQDQTKNILREYQEKDKRIIIIEEKFISIAAALNIGLKAARGEYIGRIDADNILFPDFLSGQIDFLEKNKEVDFVIANQLKIDEHNKILGIIQFPLTDYAIKKHLLFKTAIGGAPMVGRKQAFFDLGLYDDRTIITEDRIFALKGMQTKKYASIDTINYAYRIHSGAITRRYKKDAEHEKTVSSYEHQYIRHEDYYNEIEKYRDILAGNWHFKNLLLKKIANTIFFCGLHLAEQGKKKEAIAEIIKAEAIFPQNKYTYRYFCWQINHGNKQIKDTAKKFNYWLPFVIDLLQLIPVKNIEKETRKNNEDYNYWLEIKSKYSELLKKVL